MTTHPVRPLRADARHNYDALLAAGKALFAERGAEAPFEDVAKNAGIGKGTLYRHFPTRSHLVAAVMGQRFDALAARANDLVTASDPWAALVEWLREFDTSSSQYRGLSAQVGDGLADDASAVGTACLPMKRAFEGLLERAQIEAGVRRDVTSSELLTLVSAMPDKLRDARGASPLLGVIIDGLRGPERQQP